MNGNFRRKIHNKVVPHLERGDPPLVLGPPTNLRSKLHSLADLSGIILDLLGLVSLKSRGFVQGKKKKTLRFYGVLMCFCFSNEKEKNTHKKQGEASKLFSAKNSVDTKWKNWCLENV